LTLSKKLQVEAEEKPKDSHLIACFGDQ
jgi:hypothetical protein